MKRISALLLGLLLSGVFTLPAWAGTLTTNKFLYKPSLGARGDTEKNTFDAGLDRIDTRLGKEIWVGDPNYGTTLQDAITAIGTTNKAILRIPAGVWAISGDLTIPSNITLRMEKGAILAISTTITLTINGTIEAGLYQIFSWTGTGAVKFASTSLQVDIYPEWWGAVGDGVTDDIAALDACRDSMVITSGSWNFGRGIFHIGKWYAVSSTFSVDLIGNNNTTGMIFRGTGKYNSGFIGTAACDNKPVMEILGSPNIEISNFGIAGIAKTPAVGYAGTVAPSVGLLLARANGTGGGNGYNSRIIDIGFWGYFRFGNLYNWGYSDTLFMNIQTWTSPINTTPKQWMFEFFNGNCAKTRPFTAIVGTNAEILTSPAAYGGGENNKFYNCYTYMSNTSWQATGSAKVYLFGASPYFEKVFLGGLADYQFYCLDSGISIKDCGGDGQGTVSGIYVGSDAEASGWPTACTAVVSIENYNNGLNDGYIFMSDANTQLKNSRLYRVRGNPYGKVFLGKGALNSRFDANEGLISFVCNGVFQNCYLDLPSSCAELTFSNLGGMYNNIIQDQRSGGTNSLHLGGVTDVRIGLPGGAVFGSTWPSLLIGPYKMTWNYAAPTAGSWPKGSVIWATGAGVGASPGWYCRQDNTFGTLNSGATTGTITTGTKLLTVNSVTGLTIGNFIDVVADGGGNAVTAGRIVDINPTTKVVTLADNATGTATGTAVSFHNHTTAEAFEAMPATLARTSGVTGAIATGTAVTHGLGTTPTKVLLTSVDGVPTGIYPNTFGGTTFAINFAGGGSHAFYWEAIQ